MSEGEEKEQRQEYLAALREELTKEYMSFYNMDGLPTVMVMAFHKIDLAYDQICEIQEKVRNREVSLDEGAVAISILLGGLNGVRQEINKTLDE